MMFKTVDEFKAANPSIDNDDWDGVLIKSKGLIAFKRPTLSATQRLLKSREDTQGDPVQSFIDFCSSCLLSPDAATFKQLMEDYPNVLSQLEPILVKLGNSGISSAKKA